MPDWPRFVADTNVLISRDPKDEKFLGLAPTGQADFILSGDQDLLSLHPFRRIEILNPR